MNLYEREIFKYLNSFSLAITECGEVFSPEVITFYIAHTISLAENRYLNPTNYKAQFYRYIMNSNFIVISSKQDFNYVQDLSKEIFQNEDMTHKLLKFGSPSLEQSLLQYSGFEETSYKSVLLCFNMTIYQNIQPIFDLIDDLLKSQIIVYFRPHPNLRNHFASISIKDKYKENDNFIFDETIKLSNELKRKIVTIISDISSMAHTFPFTTLKPVIIHIDKSSFLYKNIKEIVRSPMQIYAKDSKQCIEMIDTIFKDQKLFKDSIIKFRNKNIYQPKIGSSRAISNFIDKIIRLK